MSAPTLPISSQPFSPSPLVSAASFIRQSRAITFARQPQLSVFAKRVLACVLAQIPPNAAALQPRYTVRLAELAREAAISLETLRTVMQATITELARACWEIEDPATGQWVLQPLLDTSGPHGLRVQDGELTVTLNPSLAPYFCRILGQYTTFQLADYLRLSSWYSMRVFEILATFWDTGWWEISLPELRELLDCAPGVDEQGNPTGKYPDNKDFLRRALGFAARELAATPLAFDYVKLTTQPRRAGRSRVVALRFVLRATKPTRLPAEWLQHPLTGKILAAMRRYKVSEQNMLTYLPLVGSLQALALVAEWDAKEKAATRLRTASVTATTC